MEKLLDVRGLAQLLGVSPGSIYHWISQGRLPVVRFSARCVRFREIDVERLLCDLHEDGTGKLTDTAKERAARNSPSTKR
jgi:excisionase family DNA binding protein